MTYPQVFSAAPGPAFTDEFQDMIREHMIARLPRVPVIAPPRKPCTYAKPAYALARARLYPKVLQLKEAGASIAVIALALGISHTTVTRILQEGPATRAPLIAPAMLQGRLRGLFYDDRIVQRMEWVADAVNRGYETGEIADALSVSRSAVHRILVKIRGLA